MLGPCPQQGVGRVIGDGDDVVVISGVRSCGGDIRRSQPRDQLVSGPLPPRLRCQAEVLEGPNLFAASTPHLSQRKPSNNLVVVVAVSVTVKVMKE